MSGSEKRREEEVRGGGAAVYMGEGEPEDVVPAPVGSLYLRTKGEIGTALYVKEKDGAVTTG